MILMILIYYDVVQSTNTILSTILKLTTCNGLGGL